MYTPLQACVLNRKLFMTDYIYTMFVLIHVLSHDFEIYIKGMGKDMEVGGGKLCKWTGE